MDLRAKEKVPTGLSTTAVVTAIAAKWLCHVTTRMEITSRMNIAGKTNPGSTPIPVSGIMRKISNASMINSAVRPGSRLTWCHSLTRLRQVSSETSEPGFAARIT